MPHFRIVTDEGLAQAKAATVRVIPWTVDERAGMERLIAMGVDAIITDDPDRLRPIKAARGMKMPMPVDVKRSGFHSNSLARRSEVARPHVSKDETYAFEPPPSPSGTPASQAPRGEGSSEFCDSD